MIKLFCSIVVMWLVCFLSVAALASDRMYIKCSATWAAKNWPDVFFSPCDNDESNGVLVWLAYQDKPVIDCSDGSCAELNADQASEFKATGAYSE